MAPAGDPRRRHDHPISRMIMFLFSSARGRLRLAG